MNFSRFLQQQPILHNPWILLIIPPLPSPPSRTQSSSHNSSSSPDHSPLLTIASHIRSTISSSRNTLTIQQITHQQRNVASTPFVPVHYGVHAPQISVSSWTDLPLFDFEFPVAASEPNPTDALVQNDGNVKPGTKSTIEVKVTPITAPATQNPVFVSCGVNLCPVLSLGGLTIDDTILTWKDPGRADGEGGMWMQGHMDEEIWKRLEGIRASFYL